MHTNPTAQEREQLAAELRRLLDPLLLGLPPGDVRKTALRSPKKITLRAASDLGWMMGLLEKFAVRGPFHVAREAAAVIVRIDAESWDLDRNYLISPLNLIDYFGARLDPRLPPIARPAALRWNPPSGPRQFKVRNVFERNPYEGYPMDMSSSIVGDAFHDLNLFARLWLEGGHEDWPLDRIHRQVDATLEGLAALPAFGPFERPEPVR